jgi:hypothetical protein
VTPAFGSHDIDGELVFARYLDEPDLRSAQRSLVTVAPRWSTNLRIWHSARGQHPLDARKPDGLAVAVRDCALRRGATYEAMTRRYGAPIDARATGSLELRGRGPALTVVISVDERPASRLGPSLQLGNRIALQVRRPTVEGRDAPEWTEHAFSTLCESLDPVWGSAMHPAEYWAKVMSDEPPLRPVGRGGVLARRGDAPDNWDSPAGRDAKTSLVHHLGADLFFDKARGNGPSRAPRWL